MERGRERGREGEGERENTKQCVQHIFVNDSASVRNIFLLRKIPRGSQLRIDLKSD